MRNLSQALQPYKGRKIAVYGLSVLTREVLPWAERECRVAGLLDGCRTEGALYGKPIISLAEAVREGVALILVAARPESCKVITKRIEGVCRAHRIALLNSQGADLLERKSEVYEFKSSAGSTKEELLQAIGRHGAVSADLFDTLVTRRTLFSTDVFELVDQRLRQRGIVVEEFAAKRMDGEKELCRRTVPTLVEIYAYIRDKYHLPDLRPEEAAELEWSVDYALLVPRKALCDLLERVYNGGKPVYIVTDSYYTKEQLIKFLDKCGIVCYTDILSSCEHRTCKSVGLFRRLRERLPGKRCIHIGDSLDTDVLAAEANGVTGWRVYSGLDLFEQVGYLGTWDALRGLSSRIQAGMFVSRLFNNPFQFEPGRTSITVESSEDIGYLFFAPVITGFVFWFRRQICERDLKNVWFSARDGYLIQKLYDRLTNSAGSTYFLTSRTAAIRAGIESREDIRYIEEMRFSGTLREQLRERFGIEAAASDGLPESGGLLEYEQLIQRAAKTNRKNYLAYLEGLEILEGDIAFFDFVARGTVQMYVGRLLKSHLKGFYFMQQDPEYMRKNRLDIVPFYSKEAAAGSAIAQSYYSLEAVLTSPLPSLNGFDSLGRPVYGEETRTEEDLRCIQAIQDGIQDYFDVYRNICPEEPEDRTLGELFLSLVHHVSIADRAFLALKVEDPFFNRRTALEDLL